MKRNLLILGLLIAFLTGCASGSPIVKLNENKTAQMVVKGSASTLGYFIGANNLDLIPKWNEWADKLLGFEQGDSTLSFQDALIKGADLVIDSPFLKLKFEELVVLFEFPKLQSPKTPFLTGPYIEMVKLILTGFKDGLEAALAEAGNL